MRTHFQAHAALLVLQPRLQPPAALGLHAVHAGRALPGTDAAWTRKPLAAAGSVQFCMSQSQYLCLAAVHPQQTAGMLCLLASILDVF